MEITSFFLRKYSTLTLTYVTEYNSKSHSDTQTEWNEDELTKWIELHYVEHTTTLQNLPATDHLVYDYGFIIRSL